MPGPYYADADIASSGDGSSWAQAFKTLTEAEALVAPGDIVFGRGTFTEKLTVLTAGTGGAGTITYIGCRSDGTPWYLTDEWDDPNSAIWIDGQSTQDNGIYNNGVDNRAWRNIRVRNTTSNGWNSDSTTDFWLLDHCGADNVGGDGFFCATLRYSYVNRWTSSNTGGNGFNGGNSLSSNISDSFCISFGLMSLNTAGIAAMNTTDSLCVITEGAAEGTRAFLVRNGTSLCRSVGMNRSSAGSSYGVYVNDVIEPSSISRNIFEGFSTGVLVNVTRTAIIEHNYFFDCVTEIDKNATAYTIENDNVSGTESALQDPANGNYMVKPDFSMRNLVVSYDSINIGYMSTGIEYRPSPSISTLTPASGATGDAIAIAVLDAYSRTVSTVTINGQAATIASQTPSGNNTTVNVTAPAGLNIGSNAVIVTLSDGSTAVGNFGSGPGEADVRLTVEYDDTTRTGTYDPTEEVVNVVTLTIKDQGGAPMQGVKVVVRDSSDSASIATGLTASDGTKQFTLADGSYVVRLQKSQYQPDTILNALTVSGDTADEYTMTYQSPSTPAAGVQTLTWNVQRLTGVVGVGAVMTARLLDIPQYAGTSGSVAIIAGYGESATADSNGDGEIFLVKGCRVDLGITYNGATVYSNRITVTDDDTKDLSDTEYR